MSAWQSKYSDEQRAAIERAAVELQIRPWRRICELAAAGELTAEPGGDPLPAFELRESSARTIARTFERRREGLDVPAAIANLPARDRAHALQLRLSGLIDHELARLERLQRNGRALDVERARQIARALRELATLPDPHERRLPRAPGDREPGTGGRPEGATRDGLAGALLRAHNRTGSPPARDDTHRETDHDVYTAPTTTTDDNDTTTHAHEPTSTDTQRQASRVDGTGLTADLVTAAPAQ